MKKIWLILLLSALIAGCTTPAPNEGKIESMVRESLLGDGLGDLFEIENFAKTNGFRESDNVFIADIEYDLVFQKSFIDVVREIRADPTGPQYGVFGSKFILTAIQSNFGQFERGDKIRKTDKVRFHHTEKGWLIAE